MEGVDFKTARLGVILFRRRQRSMQQAFSHGSEVPWRRAAKESWSRLADHRLGLD